MSEFKVNKFITLKLEKGETNIYVNGKLFNQCKYVLTRKKVYELEDLLEIESVDELADKSIDEMIENLNHSLEGVEPELIDIPPETRFWVHCSNMEIWVENNYDTRLLHSNLAFPLLKELNEIGDPLAKRVFKEEIAKRLEKGTVSTVIYLFDQCYEYYLENEELKMLIYNPNSSFFENLIKYLSHQDRDETLVEVILDFLGELEIDVTLKAKIIKLLKTEDENVLIELIIRVYIDYLDDSTIGDLFLNSSSRLRENIIQILNPEGLNNNWKKSNFIDNFFETFLTLLKRIYINISGDKFIEFLNHLPIKTKKRLQLILLKKLEIIKVYSYSNSFKELKEIKNFIEKLSNYIEPNN